MFRTSIAFAALAFVLAGCAAETTTEPTESSPTVQGSQGSKVPTVAEGSATPDTFTKGGWYCFPWEDVYCEGIPPRCWCVPHKDDTTTKLGGAVLSTAP